VSGYRVKLHCRITDLGRGELLAEFFDIEPSTDYARDHRSQTFGSMDEAQSWCADQVNGQVDGSCHIVLQWNEGSAFSTSDLFI